AAAQVRARAALRAHAAREYELIHVIGQPVAQLLAQRVSEREHSLDVRLRGTGADDPGARLAAEQQIQRVREHGLARARLPREHVEPGTETELCPLDQKKVLYAQLVQ